MIAEPLQETRGNEPGNPYRIETDATGQKWRVGPDGSRLKVGGTIGPGAPKKEVREKWLKLANKPSLEWAIRILSNPGITDSDPVKLKAIELSLAYGLGKQDEKVEMKSAQVFEGYSRRLTAKGWTPEEVGQLAADVASDLAIAS